MKYTLGISAYYHDSAAAIIADGRILSAAQEERFTRKKHDPAFPKNAIEYCLDHANLEFSDLSRFVFYDQPTVKFDRLIKSYLSKAPRGYRTFRQAIPVWLSEKLFLRRTIARELKTMGISSGPEVEFAEHHKSHAASAFFPSPFEEAVVLCLDGVGEWATTTAWHGKGDELAPLWHIDFPHSLGLLYSAFTDYTGFKVNSGEYKLMGLAPYGEPKYVDKIYEHLVDVRPDGSFKLDTSYFAYIVGSTMVNDKFADLFGGPKRLPESQITQKEMDLAASIQQVTEEIVLKLGNALHRETGVDHLCLAGGVALNCVANGKLQREGPFQRIWIQPAAGDAGGAVGAALLMSDKRRNQSTADRDGMQGAYLGPEFADEAIEAELDANGANYMRIDESEFYSYVAEKLADCEIVGWFQGRMEFGPRALGGRSILGNPQDERTQSTMNLKIKYRESFRPFAPSVLADDVQDYFKQDDESPYMLIVAEVQDSIRVEMSEEEKRLFGIEKLNIKRSQIPAVTHVDYSARVQTVHEDTNPRYYALLKSFKQQSGCSVVVNTSFNVRGEPIVCSPTDAYRCFMRTDMDVLVVGNYVMLKAEQPEFEDSGNWREEFELD